MKQKITITISLALIAITFFWACNEELPTVENIDTNKIGLILTLNNVNGSSADLTCTLTNPANVSISEHGFCWNTTGNPTTSDFKSESGALSTTSFNENIESLEPETDYYVKAYVIVKEVTIYSEQTKITTTNGLAVLTTTAISDITATTATSGGSITDDNGFEITARGVCWSTSQNPTILDSCTTNDSGIGSFTSSLAELDANTIYYVRAFATNVNSTEYGNEISFTTLDGLASLTTSEVNDVTATTAKSGGNITDDGGDEIIARGVCWATTSNPTINDFKTVNGSGIGEYTSILTGLNPNTSYYARSYCINNIDTAYGSAQMFVTQNGIPTLTTTAVSNITAYDAKSGGETLSDGGSDILTFGICWSTNNPPTINDQKTIEGSGLGNFESSITGLNTNTSYYVRAYAINEIGVFYGDVKYFKSNYTGTNGTLTDVDGNTYNWVGIGTQIWMAENLKTTHYPNGDNIPLVTDNTTWANLSDNDTDDAYCYYDNSITNCDIYGALYTYAAAKNACPTGWHLPSDAEWTTLTDYVGGANVAGTVLKATSGWSVGENGTDNYGFTALPGRLRYNYNSSDWTVIVDRSGGYWWSSTEDDEEESGREVYYRHMYDDKASVLRSSYYMSTGFSVRCVKD